MLQQVGKNLSFGKLKWSDDEQMFRCRTGACRFEATWDRMQDVGYRPFKDGVVFVAESDFEEKP